MGKLTEKVKDTLTGAKDTVVGEDENDDERSRRVSGSDREYEEGAAGTQGNRRDDPLTEYESKEPMTPAKIKEHEPTAVRREMTENITEPGQVGTNPQEAAEKARRSGMTKGTAGAGQTGSEYEQGAAGTNQ